MATIPHGQPPFLGTHRAASIAATNAAIAAGSMAYVIGSTIMRAEDGIMLTLQGVGAAAQFLQPVADLSGAVKTADLAAAGGASTVGGARETSSTGLNFGTSNLQILVRSSPIDVREALPGNFDATGQTNYTTQIQKVLDYLRDFGGGTLLLPANVSLLINMLRIYTGTEIVAPDWTSELIASPDGYGWGMSVNPLNGGTPDPADNQRNIRLSGFSIRGQAAIPTFSEHQHLLNMNAVSDLLIECMRIRGQRGDGIYLGSSNTAGLERHNERIVIDRCTIDGVNAENRNGISIIDGSQVVISKTRILNCTRLGQPGAIDMEPDANLYARIRDVTVEDFYIFGGFGSGVACLLRPNATLTIPVSNIRVLRGTIVNKASGLAYQRNTVAPAVVPRDGVVYSDIEVKNCGTPFLFDSVVGGTMRNVKFSDCTKQAELGYIYGNRDILLDNVTMERCGTAETNGLRIRTIDGLQIDRSLFSDCGRSDVASGRAIYFADGTGTNISITNTTIASPTGKTTTNIGVESATYTLNQSTCRDYNNSFLVAAQQFIVDGSRGLSAAPTLGTWVAGQQVFASASVLAANGIERWKVTVGGVDAAVKWEPVFFHPFRRMVVRNYQVTENFDAGVYDIFSLNIQSNPALTYNAPTNGTMGQEVTIRVRNASGGAMGAITWAAGFKMAGDWVNPANGKSRSITFVYDGTNWIQTVPVTGDVSN